MRARRFWFGGCALGVLSNSRRISGEGFRARGEQIGVNPHMSERDPCLFFAKDKKKRIVEVLATYLDDVLITGRGMFPR